VISELYLQVREILSDAGVAAATKAHVGKGLLLVLVPGGSKAVGLVRQWALKHLGQHVVEVG